MKYKPHFDCRLLGASQPVSYFAVPFFFFFLVKVLVNYIFSFRILQYRVNSLVPPFDSRLRTGKGGRTVMYRKPSYSSFWRLQNNGEREFPKRSMNKRQSVPIMKQLLEGTREIIDFQVLLSFALA